jgi:hypothetical protein
MVKITRTNVILGGIIVGLCLYIALKKPEEKIIYFPYRWTDNSWYDDWDD